MAAAALSAVPYALPAATATLAYLNARHGFTNDWPLVSTYISSQIGMSRQEKKDRVNMFYDLEDNARNPATANQAFLIFNGKRWTYKESHATILRYARWLKEDLGVGKGEVVAMDFMNGDLFVWLWFSLWSLGAKPAFINYNLTGQPLIHSIKTSSARLVLVDPDVHKEFTDVVVSELTKDGFRSDGGKIEIIVLDKAVETKIEGGKEWREPDESRSGNVGTDMAMLIYTSGTTGLPKPAVVSWTKANTGGRFISGFVPLKSGDTLYTPMPLYHSSAAILGLLSTVKGGATMALGRKFSVNNFWNEVRAANATHIQYVGETCRYLLSAPKSDLDKTHNVRIAYGNGLRPDVWGVFKERFGIPTILEFYAATEGPSMVINRSSNGFSQGAIGRIGLLAKLLLGSNMAIVEIDFETNTPIRNPKTGLLTEVRINQPGEMLFKLDEKDINKKFQGYYGNDKATNSKIIRDVRKKGDAWFSTGDVIRWDDEGRIWFMDRIGDTFRWRSENVSTAEVGEVLGKVPGINEANVYGVEVPKHDGRAGCAAIILDGQAPSNPGVQVAAPSAQILEALARDGLANLPRYAVPLFLRFTSAMELTGTNKQQKNVLRTQGIDVSKVENAGDRLYWLQGNKYVPFSEGDFIRIKGGSVKL